MKRNWLLGAALVCRVGVISVFMLVVFVIGLCDPASGQGRIHVHSFGMDMGLTSTKLFSNSETAASQFRFYGRHGIAADIFGELDLGIGYLIHDSYESRFLPVEYRVSKRLNRWLDFPDLIPETYAYAGGGIMRYQGLRVGVSDDPELAESDPGIGNSSLWDHGSGWSYQVPVGLEVHVPLLEQTSLRIRGGYNFANSPVHHRDRVINGYWGLTIGLSTRPQSRQAIPIVYPRFAMASGIQEPVLVHHAAMPEPAPVIPASNEPYPTLFNITFPTIHYELIAYDLSGYDVEVLDQIVRMMRSYPDLKLEVDGYADPRGHDVRNQSLSNLRAWKVKKYFLRKGISAHRVRHVGYGAEYLPVASPEMLEAVWAQSRRVEIRVTSDSGRRHVNEMWHLEPVTAEMERASADDSMESTEPEGIAADPEEIVAEPGIEEMLLPPQNHRLLLPPGAITFREFSDELSPDGRSRLNAVIRYLKEHPDAAVSVDGYSVDMNWPEVEQMLADARAARVSDYLVQHGIDISRLLIQERVIPGNLPDGIRVWSDRISDRRVEVVLVIPEDEEEINE